MISAALRRLWPLALAALALAALVLTGRRNGALTQQLRATEARLTQAERMRHAVATTRTDRAGVLERLRNGSF